MNIDELALKVGATHYSPAPMRAVKGWSFTFEQLQALIAEYEKGSGSEPVALPSLPGGIVNHAQLGELFDRLQMQTYAVKYAGIYHHDPRVAELEAEVAGLKENRDWWISEHANQVARTNEEIHIGAELEAQNAALLVAIEQMRKAYALLENFAQSVGGSSSFWEDFAEELETASIIANFNPPSTELLEARDRKRDAKLLRAIAEEYGAGEVVYPVGYLSELADIRESGEWKPELGD